MSDEPRAASASGLSGCRSCDRELAFSPPLKSWFARWTKRLMRPHMMQLPGIGDEHTLRADLRCRSAGSGLHERPRADEHAWWRSEASEERKFRAGAVMTTWTPSQPVSRKHLLAKSPRAGYDPSVGAPAAMATTLSGLDTRPIDVPLNS